MSNHARSVVIAVNAFKETLPAEMVANRCAAAVEAHGFVPVIVPVADGGDGLLDAVGAGGSMWRRTTAMVTGPLGAPVEAPMGWLDSRVAIIETSLICGLRLVPPARRNPGLTTTRGVGEAISMARTQGAKSVYVGLGGSATMDGGIGMAGAWGWRAVDGAGETVPDGGEGLARAVRLAPGSESGLDIVGLVDVRNPLLGSIGARVYAAQKGATKQQEERLERALRHLVRLTAAWGGEAIAAESGTGAAGGLGFGIRCFGKGKLRSGAAWMLDRAGFDAALRRAAALITAEGTFDATSWEGKLTGEVLRRAERLGVPAVLLAPTASSVPAGVVVETGGGVWDASILQARAGRAIERLRRLLHE